MSKPFLTDKKTIVIKAGRRTGKTYNTIAACLAYLLTNPNNSMLHIDTIQGNLSKYQERYYKKMLGKYFPYPEWEGEQFKKTIKLMNGSYIDFVSAERPHNMEGFEYDVIFLNEAGIILKNKKLWYNSLQPMTTKAKKVYIVGTPKGKNLFMEIYNTVDTNQESFTYTAYESPYHNHEDLDAVKSQVPSYVWQQEYLADFVDLYDTSILDMDDIHYYDNLYHEDFESFYIHADTTHTGSSTSDYFAMVAIGLNTKDKNYYVIDYVLAKMDVEKQARSAITMYMKYKSKVKRITFDEKANQGFGYWTRKLAKEEYNLSLPLEELKYNLDKVTHFTPHVPHFKSGRVWLPSNHPQNHLATDQLLAFPNKSANDDFVDGISGCLDNFLNPHDSYYSIS